MRVGVVLPVRTPAPHLERALRAVLDQDPAPDEVVVVDDASAEPIELREERARLVRRAERGGPAAARATALAHLDTELVALADADDEWRPGKLGAQLAALERHRDAAVCFGRAIVVDAEGRETGETWEAARAGPQDRESFARELYAHNPIAAPSVLVRRDALERAGGFEADVLLAEDYDLWLRLAGRGELFVYEPAAEVTVRRHPGSLSADLAALAQCSLAVHRAHAAVVDPATARRVQARDLRALAQGRVRLREWVPARRALAEAAALEPLPIRFRAIDALTRVPLARGMLGRRDPYRTRVR